MTRPEFLRAMHAEQRQIKKAGLRRGIAPVIEAAPVIVKAKRVRKAKPLPVVIVKPAPAPMRPSPWLAILNAANRARAASICASLSHPIVTTSGGHLF